MLNLKCDKRPSPLVKAEETLEAYLASGALPAFGSAVAELVESQMMVRFERAKPWRCTLFTVLKNVPSGCHLLSEWLCWRVKQADLKGHDYSVHVIVMGEVPVPLATWAHQSRIPARVDGTGLEGAWALTVAPPGWQGHVSVEIEMAEEVAGTMVCCKLRGYTYPLRAVLQWQGHWEDPSGRILAEKQVNAKYVQVSPWMNYKEAVETLSVLRTVSKTIEIHGGTPDLKQLLLQKMAFGAEEDKEEAPVGGN